MLLKTVPIGRTGANHGTRPAWPARADHRGQPGHRLRDRRGAGRRGAAVGLVARGEAGLADAAARLAAHGAPVATAAADVLDPAAVQRATDDIAAQLGGLDQLVANAGGTVGTGNLTSAGPGRVHRHVRAERRARRGTAPGRLGDLRAAGGGAVVIISSITGLRPAPRTAYAAAKAAEIQLAATAAEELAPDNIRVYSVSPGLDHVPPAALGPVPPGQTRGLRHVPGNSVPVPPAGPAGRVADVVTLEGRRGRRPGDDRRSGTPWTAGQQDLSACGLSRRRAAERRLPSSLHAERRRGSGRAGRASAPGLWPARAGRPRGRRARPGRGESRDRQPGSGWTAPVSEAQSSGRQVRNFRRSEEGSPSGDGSPASCRVTCMGVESQRRGSGGGQSAEHGGPAHRRQLPAAAASGPASGSCRGGRLYRGRSRL